MHASPAPPPFAWTSGEIHADILLAAGPLGRGAVRLTRPVPALALYAAALIAWHLPGPYTTALEIHGWHIVEHLVLLATAVLAWWPVASASTLAPRLHYGAQILYLFAFGMPMTVVAAMITGAEEVLYPFCAEAARATGMDPIAEQRLGGILMWVPAGVVPLVAFTIVFFRWAAAEADDVAEGMDCPKARDESNTITISGQRFDSLPDAMRDAREQIGELAGGDGADDGPFAA